MCSRTSFQLRLVLWSAAFLALTMTANSFEDRDADDAATDYDLTEIDWSTIDESEEQQPAQMTAEWWDLHYQEVFKNYSINGDPRVPGALGGDFTDQQHFDASLSCIEEMLEPILKKHRSQARNRGENKKKQASTLQVLVLGCGISSLIFMLADRWPVEVACLEISQELVSYLQAAALRVPRRPSLHVGDITAIARRRRVPPAGREGPVAITEASPFQPGSFDVIIDENVMDGMLCRFPQEAGASAQRMALGGIRWLLRPGGHLFTLSFAPMDEPPYAAALADWEHLGSTCPPRASRSSSDDEAAALPAHLQVVHASSWVAKH